MEPRGVLSDCVVDIIYARCQPRGSCRLSFRDFLAAVAVLADEGGWMFSAVSRALCAAADVISVCSPQLQPKPEQLPPSHDCSVVVEITKGDEVKKPAEVTALTAEITATDPAEARQDLANLASSDQLLPDIDPSMNLAALATSSADVKEAFPRGIPASGTDASSVVAVDDGASAVVPAELCGSLALESQLERQGSTLDRWQQNEDHPLGALICRLMLAEAAIAEHRQQLATLKKKQESLTDVVGEVVEVLEAANLDAFSSMQAELEDMGQQGPLLTTADGLKIQSTAAIARHVAQAAKDNYLYPRDNPQQLAEIDSWVDIAAAVEKAASSWVPPTCHQATDEVCISM
eukprot:gene10345-10502_t